MSLKDWLIGTFSAPGGDPSFKRQVGFLIIIAIIIGVFMKVPHEYIATLCLLFGAVIGVAGAEKAIKK